MVCTRFGLRMAVPVVGLVLAAGSLRAQDASAPAMQTPADRKALKTANGIADPEQRLAALRQFLHDYPESRRAEAAHNDIFHTLLESFPGRRKEIDREGKWLVAHADPGSARGDEENEVAYELAMAKPHGVDLKAAERWSEDATRQNSEAAFDKAMLAEFAKEKMTPLPTAEELHSHYGHSQAGLLQTLGEIYAREGKLDQATTTLDQARTLYPDEGEIYATMAEVAMARNQDGEALKQLELAELYGGIRPEQQPELEALYRSAHGGSDAGLQGDLDAQYAQLRPALFTPAPYTGKADGRTVLVELFTGAGCDPCAAADLAMDGVLEAYPRSEVVALSFDLHIPHPDPLANPDTEARADFYGVNYTPYSLIDGQPGPAVGGERKSSEKIYGEVAKQIDAQLGTAPGLSLSLTAHADAQGAIEASAAMQVTDRKAVLEEAKAAPPAGTTAGAPTVVTPTAAAASPAPAPPKFALRFALVQQNVRYTGENGVRFHHMIVRALSKPTELDLAAMTAPQSATASFDPAAISAALSEYLAAYAKHSERFGTIQFLSTDTALPIAQLAVAAWVEDPETHRVLQAAYVPLQPVAAGVREASR